MPAERGKDAAERFAAAADRGRPPRSAGSDPDLARELTIVAMLRSQDRTYASHADAVAMLRSDTTAYAPRPDEKARAKQRLMAMLAEPGAGTSGSGAEVVEFPVRSERRGATAVDPVVVSDSERRGATTVDPAVASDAEPEIGSDADVQLAPVTPLASRSAQRAGRHSRVSRPASRPRTTTSDRRSGFARRAGLVGSAALLVMVAFTGAGVFASRDALPGQTLYPLKRAAEAAGLAMTFDDEARAQRNLELAAIRLSEIEQLVASRGTAGVDPQLLRAAMLEFDTATNEGSRTLLSNQDRAGNGGITTLQAWAATQSARLSALRSALPIPAVPAADTSIALLDRLLGRSPELDTRTPAAAPSGDLDTTTSNPAQRGSEAARNPGGSGATGETGQSGLPPISPDSGPLGSEPAVDPVQPNTPEEAEKQDSAPLPLPLPGAPVTLPPLLPGMPPLTIG